MLVAGAMGGGGGGGAPCEPPRRSFTAGTTSGPANAKQRLGRRGEIRRPHNSATTLRDLDTPTEGWGVPQRGHSADSREPSPGAAKGMVLRRRRVRGPAKRCARGAAGPRVDLVPVVVCPAQGPIAHRREGPGHNHHGDHRPDPGYPARTEQCCANTAHGDNKDHRRGGDEVCPGPIIL